MLNAMTVFYTDHFVLPLPDGHRFPMSKYSALREWVIAHNDGRFRLEEPGAASVEELTLAHDADYVQRVFSGQLSDREQRELGFPWSPQLVERSRRSVGATIAASVKALSEQVSVSLAGGTHHAFAGRAQGYCVFNDAVVAARCLQSQKRLSRVAIVDCDVHQGNGTASIVADDANIFSFSIHGARNFPVRKEQSDLDVALEDNVGDAAYLAALSDGLAQVNRRFQPDLVIYLAGADPYEGDRWGRVGLTKAGLAQRDELVMSWCVEHKYPFAVTMAGGYAPDIQDIVDIHTQTVASAWQCRAHQF